MDQFGYRYPEQQTGYRPVPTSAALKPTGKGSHIAEGAQKRYLLRSIAHGIGTAIMAIAIALAVALVGVRLLGYDVYAVLSGSMEPTYHVGSVIYVKDCEPEEVQVGDPITFVMNEDLVVATHRVVEVDPEKGCYYTKGDANEEPDGAPVLYENLIGKPVFTIPYLGYIADYVQEPPGTYVAIAVCAVIIMITFIPDLFAKDEDEEETPKRKKKNKKSASEPGLDPAASPINIPAGAPVADSRAYPCAYPATYAQQRAQQPYLIPNAYAQQPYGACGVYDPQQTHDMPAAAPRRERAQQYAQQPATQHAPQAQAAARPQRAAAPAANSASSSARAQAYRVPNVYAQQPANPQQRQTVACQNAVGVSPYDNSRLQTPARQNPAHTGRHARPAQQDWSQCPTDDATQGGSPGNEGGFCS